jgi:hypothetical protein
MVGDAGVRSTWQNAKDYLDASQITRGPIAPVV